MTIKFSNDNQTMEECRQQNSHYWKIIEKQRYYIQNLQKLIVQVSNENEALVKRNRELEGHSISSTETPPYLDTMQLVKELLSQGNSFEHVVSPNMSPVPPPRSPYRVNGGIAPLTAENNVPQPIVDLPKRPPALKLAMSNHSPLHLRSAQETDMLTRDYLTSPRRPVHHPSSPTFHSPTASPSSDFSRMTYESDNIISPKSGTSPRKFTQYNSNGNNSKEKQYQMQQHVDSAISASNNRPASPPSLDVDTDRDSENFSLIDAYVRNLDIPERTHRKSFSEPNTPMKVRTPRYDSLAQNNSGNGSNPLDSSADRMKILNNLANISIKVTQPAHKSKMSPTFSIMVCRQVRGEDDYPLWSSTKYLSDFAHLDLNLKKNSAIASKLNKLTDSSIFSSRAFSKSEDQVTAIEEYLQHVISLRLIDSYCLCNFLCSESVESVDGRHINPDLVQGYLTKRRRNFGGRKKRYFVLENEFMKYYESKEGAFLGMIRLSNSQISEYISTEHDTETGEYGFVILEQRKAASSRLYRHTLFSDSVSEREMWINTLKNSTDATFIEDSNKHLLSEPKIVESIDTLILEPSSSTESVRNATVRKRPSMDYIFSYFHGSGGRRRSSASNAVRESTSAPSTPDAANLVNDTGDADSKKQKPRSPRRAFWGKKKAANHNELLPPISPSYSNMLNPTDGIHPYSEEEDGNSNSKVFGITLDNVVSISKIYNNYQLPSIAYRCIEYIEHKNGLLEEGIYRMSGSSLKLQFLRKRFNEEGDIDLLADKEEHDVHTIAGLLKMWLRELPESILTEILLEVFLQSLKLNEKMERTNELSRLISQLPLVNYTLLRTLCSHLIRIIQNANKNKMTLRNVVIVFSATLGIPSGIFSLFLTDFECIFSTARHQNSITSRRRYNEIPLPLKPSDEYTASTPIQIKINDHEQSNRNSFHYQDHAPKNTIELENLLEENPLSFDEDEDLVYEDESYFSEGELGVAYLAHRQNANANSTVLN